MFEHIFNKITKNVKIDIVYPIVKASYVTCYRFGPRFPPASQCYNFKLRELIKKLGAQLGMNEFLREGVYCFLGGPSFETVTECRFLKVAGVDATGIVK